MLVRVLFLLWFGFPACAGCAPLITAVTPQTGAVGTLVKIVGVDLDSVTSISFNGTPGDSLRIISSTHVKVVVPARATSGPLAAIGPTGRSSTTFPFLVLAPWDPDRIFYSKVIPNPSRGDISWRFNLSRAGRACLVLFNVRGVRVYTQCADYAFPGVQEIRWNGRDASGIRVPSGVYCGKLVAGERQDVRCVTLVR